MEACSKKPPKRKGIQIPLVLNYVPIIRHFHHYVHVPEHENDVPDVEEASQSEQQVTILTLLQMWKKHKWKEK